MKGVCVFVDGGKGHYVPALAIQEELNDQGIATGLEEFFDFLGIRRLGRFNKHVWRLMLKMPKAEQSFSRKNDTNRKWVDIAIGYGYRHCAKRLEAYLRENEIDFVFATHPYASTVISGMLKKMGNPIPVYYFATDVFSAPEFSISNDLRKFYIATKEGAERVRQMGQDPKTIEVCPFPLQRVLATSPKLSKKEARAKLGIAEDLFTVQLNLGGEGLGTTGFLEELAKRSPTLQIVVIGGMEKGMQKKLEEVQQHLPPSMHLIIKGFVKNVNEYLAASDVIVGRAGINTIVEAIYAHRPFLITELVYTVIPSADYVVSHRVGWNCANDKVKQAEVVMDLVSHPEKIEEMEGNYDAVPIVYSAKALADMIASDVRELKKL